MEHGFEIEIDLAPGGADTSSVPAHLVAIAGYPGASQSPSPWRLRAASLQRPRTSPSRPAALSSAGPSLIAIDSQAPGKGDDMTKPGRATVHRPVHALRHAGHHRRVVCSGPAPINGRSRSPRTEAHQTSDSPGWRPAVERCVVSPARRGRGHVDSHSLLSPPAPFFLRRNRPWS